MQGNSISPCSYICLPFPILSCTVHDFADMASCYTDTIWAYTVAICYLSQKHRQRIGAIYLIEYAGQGNRKADFHPWNPLFATTVNSVTFLFQQLTLTYSCYYLLCVWSHIITKMYGNHWLSLYIDLRFPLCVECW